MKVDRLISIIMILLDKERIGAQELADLFEVSPRTIYRDIDAINRAGIPICSTSGVGGGFEIMKKYKLDKNVFSMNELSAILMGLSSLSGMMKGEQLVNALTKVRSFIPADRAKDIELKVNQIQIDLNPWIGNRNIPFNIEMIKTALQESKILAFEYIDHHNHQTKREIEPYQLILKNSHWYVYGYCYKRNDFRLFKLSRMSHLKIKDEVFTMRTYQKPQMDATDIVTEMQTEVKIRIHHSIMERVLDYCSYEHFIPDGDEYYIVTFPFIENQYYYHVLLSFGDQCECLEPSHIRSEMKRRIQNIANIYRT